MGSIGIMAWRVRIGCFNSIKVKYDKKYPWATCCHHSLLIFLFNLFFFIYSVLGLLVKMFLLPLTSAFSKSPNIFFLSYSEIICSIFCLWWISYLILLSGDIELNPGHNRFKVMHWNLNSISTDSFSRKTLVETYNFTENYDLIAITESNIHKNVHDNESFTLRGTHL